MARLAVLLLTMLRRLAGLAMRGARATAELLLALLLLFWEWGWRPLVLLIGQLARLKPWALAEVWIARLPPYGALVIFALPSVLLLPLKLLAFWLIAKGKIILAGTLLASAKLVGTALVARIFLLTRPALMRLAWFARLYNWLVPWQEAIFARIRASWAWRYGRLLKTRAVQSSRRLWSKWRPVIAARWQAIRPQMAAALARLRALGRKALERIRALYSANSPRS